MKETKVRSPLFYTGDKYKLIPSLKQYFPKNIRKFVEPFVGGGSVFLNIEAEEFYENDIDSNIISIHKYFCSYKEANKLIDLLISKIKTYGFSCSYLDEGASVPKELKEQFIKTYYAKFNKQPNTQLKDKFNSSDKTDIADLYLLLIYGFNRMLRFNNEGKFNLPVGNVDFNKNAFEALTNYVNLVNKKKIKWFNEDFSSFFEKIDIPKDDFIYVDPPYLITSSEYNKIWIEEDDNKLMSLLDTFNENGIPFAMSNVVSYKEKINNNLINWSEKYHVIPIKSNYINYHDNSIKTFGEVLITNYVN